MSDHKGATRRKLVNYLLQPLIQVKLGVYSVILSLVFASLVVAILYRMTMDSLEILGDFVKDERTIDYIFTQYFGGVAWLLFLIFVFYVLSNLAISIVVTHRLVGPVVAFRRHIASLEAGDYSKRVRLRRGDAFGELAEDLNRLTMKLEREGETRRTSSSQDPKEEVPTEG